MHYLCKLSLKTSFKMKYKSIYPFILSIILFSCGSIKENKHVSTEKLSDTTTIKSETSTFTDNSPHTKKAIQSPQNLRGEWIIIKAMGRPVDTMKERAYIFFSSKENKIYGYTGCNYINGGYSIYEGFEISLKDIITTSKICEAINEERNIIQGINSAFSYSIYKDSKTGLDMLDLKDNTGHTVLHMKRHNADVISGTWSVESIRGKDNLNQEIQLVIDVPELHLHGKTGCNFINGDIGIDRNKDRFVQFQSISSTRKMCDDKTMKVERELLIALEEVEFIKKKSNDIYALLDKNRKEVLVLKKIVITVNNGL